jgi:CO/xanthine dehydrogenase Mo-binding subunit
MSPVRPSLSRRKLLGGGGALIVSFSLGPPELLPPPAQGQAQEPRLPGSLRTTRMLDAWIRIDAGGITVYTGKVELGQGIKTALLQVAAEELAVEPGQIALITADTARTPNEGFTSGSQSMQDSATALRHAAAQVRELLIGVAAARWGVAADQLTAKGGNVSSADGRSASYRELASAELLRVEAQPASKLRQPDSYALIGRPMPRVDIPAKVTGGVAYVQDLRLPGMLHARVVRPPSYAARLRAVDAAAVERMPGVIKVVRDGSFLAVVARREYQAVQAMDALARASRWDESKSLPAQAQLYDWVRNARSDEHVIHEARGDAQAGNRTLQAVYHRPYQMHGSVGPSCAVALAETGALKVWTHSQGVYPLRGALAGMLRLAPDKVHCIHMEGSGCYGHNGADDVAADAALLAMALLGQPVRVQWMRDQEHAWEPYGAAMVTSARASLDARGHVADWHYEVWSNAHSTRPGGAGNLMPAWHIATPFTQPVPAPIPQPTGGGDRNAIPLYRFANARVLHHFIPGMPLRVSALRALGAYMNVFSVESFVDELAQAAGTDPVEFRLRHLEDARARDVIWLAAEKFGWSSTAKLPEGRGRGFGFARYKNLAAYTAVAAELEVEHETGRIRLLRLVAANDCGEIVNPDGVRNQIEGGIVQSASWTLHEAVGFDDTRITSCDWSTYPILRFRELPAEVDVHLIDRPGQPFLGTGEAAQGPTAAAIANALASATGLRVRELPFTRRRVKAAIGV